MFDEGGFLDGQYTVWGEVDAAGMACVDKIERGEPPANSRQDGESDGAIMADLENTILHGPGAAAG